MFEKMLNCASYWGNANYKYNKIHLLECLLPTRQVITSFGEIVKKKEPSFTAGGNVNWYNYYEKHYGGSSKN